MSTTLAYAYSHLIRYFTKGIDAQGPYYRVEYSIANWSDADGFVNALLGKATLTGGVGGTVTRITPHQHPLSTNLYCSQAEVVEGVGKPVLASTGYPSYSSGAIIRAEYRAPTFDFSSNVDNSFDVATPITWATQELDFGSEAHTINNSSYRWQAGPDINLKVGVPVKITIPLTTMVLTYESVPYMPMVVARALRFRVNNATFLGAVAGTVLFEGCHTGRQFNTDGTVTQKVQFIFKERDPAHPWNSLPSRSTLAWYPVSDTIGGTNRIFPPADLSPLVQF